MRLLKGLFSLVLSLMCLALGAQIQVGDTLRVAVFTDTHISPGTAADENLSQAIESVNKSDYDFVIVSGDVSNVGSDAELQNVYNKLKALRVPYFFVPRDQLVGKRLQDYYGSLEKRSLRCRGG